MNRRLLRLLPLSTLLVGLALAGHASADTLLIERAQQLPAAQAPARGMSMQQVESRFGAPSNKLDPRGGQRRQWPTINRWTYPGFIVYFEKNRVIDVVAIKADASESGPKAPIR